MSTLAEYFIVMGSLLLLYLFIRTIFWWDRSGYDRIASYVPADWKHTAEIGRPIDTSKLSTRVQSVRQGFQAEVQPKPLAFKCSLRVESKREELAQKAFFQRPPQVEPLDEHEQHGAMLILV